MRSCILKVFDLIAKIRGRKVLIKKKSENGL